MKKTKSGANVFGPGDAIPRETDTPTEQGLDMTDLEDLQRQLAKSAVTSFDLWQGGALVMLIRETRLLRAGVRP